METKPNTEDSNEESFHDALSDTEDSNEMPKKFSKTDIPARHEEKPSYITTIEANVPKRYVATAVEMIQELIRNNVIVIDREIMLN